jgi:threonine synthase
MVLSLDTDFDGCMAIVQRLADAELVYLANSMNALRLEGQKTVAIEIVQQFDWQVPDWIVLPSGNLGNAGALYAGFRMMKELGIIDRYPRLAVAQAEAANPLYRAWTEGKKEVAPVKARPTLATAIQIGNPVSSPRALRALEAMNGVVEQATEEELSEAAARADRTGMYTCPHTAVALAVLEKLLARGVIDKKARIVVISTAAGLKFTEFKVRYHERSLPGLSSAQANPPIELPADYERVVEAIERHHRLH